MKPSFLVLAMTSAILSNGCNSAEKPSATDKNVKADSASQLKYATIQASSQAATVPTAVNIHYNVNLIAQPDKCTCWAASAAMVRSYWHDVETSSSNPLYTIQQMKDQVTSACSNCDISCGLAPADTKRAGDALNLSFDQPQCYGVSGFASLLESKGPLVFIRAANGKKGAHAIVVIGMKGDGSVNGTNIETLNPSPVNQGSKDTVSFASLMTKMEQLGFWDQGDWSTQGGLDRVYVMYKK